MLEGGGRRNQLVNSGKEPARQGDQHMQRPWGWGDGFIQLRNRKVHVAGVLGAIGTIETQAAGSGALLINSSYFKCLEPSFWLLDCRIVSEPRCPEAMRKAVQWSSSPELGGQASALVLRTTKKC